eukprot:m.17707 g.17707  ORF g.17707 m.17707 type:complete len:73 (+) comp27539_c0_seq1:2803-3021(+)
MAAAISLFERAKCNVKPQRFASGCAALTGLESEKGLSAPDIFDFCLLREELSEIRFIRERRGLQRPDAKLYP